MNPSEFRNPFHSRLFRALNFRGRTCLFRSCRPALLAGVAALSLAAAEAATIVSFGGDMVSGSYVDLVLPPPEDNGGVRTWPYSAEFAISPPTSYTGPEFFGALQNAPGDGVPASFPAARITDNVAVDELRVWGNAVTAGQTGVVSGLIFFKPDVEPGSTVTFAESSSLSMTFSMTSSSGANRNVRFAVLSGGVWYLSEMTKNDGGGTLSMNDPLAQLWAAWDPAAVPMGAAPSSYGVYGSEFGEIDAIGLYFYVPRKDANDPRFALQSFTGDAVVTPVPEASTVGLLGAALAVYGGCRWQGVKRRDKNSQP